jgi:hypothetical protein
VTTHPHPTCTPVFCNQEKNHAFLIDLEKVDLAARVELSQLVAAARDRMRAMRAWFETDGFTFDKFTAESLTARLKKMEPEHNAVQASTCLPRCGTRLHTGWHDAAM